MKNIGQPPIKQARHIASAVESCCSQINCFTAQNQKMMASLMTLGKDILKPDSSLDKE